MTDNVFLKDKSQYVRDVDPLNNAINSYAFYLSQHCDKTFQECKEWVVKKIKQRGPNSVFGNIKNPGVLHYEREENGDKFKKQPIPLNTYIQRTIKAGRVLAPTFTTYLSKAERPSLVSIYSKNKAEIRKKSKAVAKKYKAIKDMSNFTIWDNRQDNEKRRGNSVSGAFGSKGSPISNESSHSTLTSTVRSSVSIVNASNERVLNGNRHYRTPNIAYYNMIAIAQTCNTDEVKAVIDKYKLYLPTADDVIEVIRKSIVYYSLDFKAIKMLHDYATVMTPYQRALFVYGGDLYHLYQYNKDFVIGFLSLLSKKVVDTSEVTPNDYYAFPYEITNLTNQICNEEVVGLGVDADKYAVNNVLNVVVGTAKNIIKVVQDFKDFIDVFILIKHAPASTAYIRDLQREAVAMSDTDSSGFSPDTWVEFKYGEYVHTPESIGFASAVAFIGTQSVAHYLRQFSANLGVPEEDLDLISFKPEYVWASFGLTAVAKHYGAMTIMKESMMFDEPELELKGVHMKNSNVVKSIIQDGVALLNDILKAPMENRKISIKAVLTRIADAEREIERSLLAGEVDCFRLGKIKSKNSYSSPDSPYLNHVLWMDVFSPKYGNIEEPDYITVKVPTVIDSPVKMRMFLESIKDKDLATRLQSWMDTYKKKAITTFYPSLSYVQSYGLPEEMKSVIDTKRIIYDLTTNYRLILSMLNYFPKQNWLIKDLGY